MQCTIKLFIFADIVDIYRTELELLSGSMRTLTPGLKDRLLVSSSQGKLCVVIISLPGFDEYMNLVLDDATECHQKRSTEKKLGRIMLKGDSITLIQTKNDQK